MAIEIGIIGGSGLYDMAELTDREEKTIATPFGDPWGPYVIGTLRGKRVAFLARHGVGHRILPSELNFRANIYGFKVLGVERLVSASAVGSLKQEYEPLDIVMTNLQEAKLAREAEICYATLALVTDYDCWHPDHDSVTVDLIVANLLQNALIAQKTIAEAIDRISGPRTCACKDALATAIITHASMVPEQIKKDLSPIIGRYMK